MKDTSFEPFLVIYSNSKEDFTLSSMLSIEEGANDIINTESKNNKKQRKRRSMHKSYTNPCELKPLKVFTTELGLSNFLAPEYLTINQCIGSCDHPGSKASTRQTNHALLQALYTKVTDGKYSSYPCCAPSSFASETVVLANPDDSVKIMKLMKARVTSCACL